MPGQIAMDGYEESQRHPGDFEAQVSQRPIAVHGLEHLSETDRGISMFRNQVRRGIRAVRAGKDPAGLVRDDGVVTATYCNNTVLHLPAPPDEAADKKIMREAGMRLAKDYLDLPAAAESRVTAAPGPGITRARIALPGRITLSARRQTIFTSEGHRDAELRTSWRDDLITEEHGQGFPS